MKNNGLLKLSVFCMLILAACSARAGGNLLQLNPADSSTHHSVVWRNSPLPIVWHMSADGYPGSGITNTELETALQNAFTTWQSVPTSSVNIEYGGEIGENASGADGINLVSFTDQDYIFPSGVVAYAVHYTFVAETIIDDTNHDLNSDGVQDIPNGTYPAGTVYETDIVFNGSYNLTANDIEATALHESGHLLGLSHSVLEKAVMYPFMSVDITSSNTTLSEDDIAYLSLLYPNETTTSSYGTISGFVNNGYGGQAVLGAHVYAVNPVTGDKVVGAYSLEQGDYLIPGLATGSYYVGMEPLDGDPLAADPHRINQVIENTFDTNFTAEFYDANESNIETNTQNAELIPLVAGDAISAINFVTNTIDVPGVSFVLRTGLNLFAYPVETPEGFVAFDLLQALGNEAEINSVDRYNVETGRYERASWSNDIPAVPVGVNFPIKRGEGYLVHMQQQTVASFNGAQNCPHNDLAQGFNLIGVTCPPAGFSSFDLLSSLGQSVIRVAKYESDTATFQQASFVNGEPDGDDFTINNGTAYIVDTIGAQSGLILPGLNNIFPPFLSGVSPGRALIGDSITIFGSGFSDQPSQNEVRFNGALANVTYTSGEMLIVTVPGAATSGPLTVAVADKESNSIEFGVALSTVSEEMLKGVDMLSGQTAEGAISIDGEQDRYTFIATKGSYVSATALAVISGVPDLLLVLEGPSGEVLIIDDNSAGGTDAKIHRYELTRTGRYTLVVTNKAGSGTGAYTLKLDIENVPLVAEIVVLEGDYQSGLAGTVLAKPLELLVIGSNGQPISGASVTITTSDEVTVNSAFTAGTYALKTNVSGILEIEMTTPNVVSGEYQIIIEVPGLSSITIKASTISSMPVTVEMLGNNQDCDGAGCPVGELLPEPYYLRFLDASNQPIENILVNFDIASGDGKIKSTDTEKSQIKTKTNYNGEVKVTHRLGEKVSDSKTRSIIPQIVAVTGTTTNADVILFEAKARAGEVANVESLKSNSIRMTMGTAVLNAIQIKVVDAYGNPVPDTDINVSTIEGGLELLPGYINGELLTGMKTDQNGEFAGVLIADFQAEPLSFIVDADTHPPCPYITCSPMPVTGDTTKSRFGMSGVGPTKDEFGERVPNTEPYNIAISVGSFVHAYNVDIDMGPVFLIISDEDIGDGIISAAPYDTQWVGNVLNKPLVMRMMSYQRTDECGDPSEDGAGIGWNDDDFAWFGDEDFSLHRIRSWSHIDVFATYTADRDDGQTDSVQFTLNSSDISQLTSEIEVTTGVTSLGGNSFLFNASLEPTYVQMDNARGDIMINAKTRSYTEVVDADELCFLNNDLHYHGYQWVDPLNKEPVIFDYRLLPEFTNIMPLRVASPRIKVTVRDGDVQNNPIHGMSSEGGIDLSDLNIKLNGSSIFDTGAINSLELNEYPNFIKASVDDLDLSSFSLELFNEISPRTFTFSYYPTASEVDLSGAVSNTVDVLGVKDRLGNEQVVDPTIFGIAAP